MTKGTKLFPGLPTQADVECSGMLASCGFRRLGASDEALVEYIRQTGAAWPACKDPYSVPDAAACFFAFARAADRGWPFQFSEENGRDRFGLFAEYQALFDRRWLPLHLSRCKKCLTGAPGV